MSTRLWNLARKYPEVERVLVELRSLKQAHKKLKKGKRKMAVHLRWEYMVLRIHVPIDVTQTLLNDYGEEGWQLIQITDERGTNIGWFKRPRYYKAISKSKDQGVSNSGTLEGSVEHPKPLAPEDENAL